MPLLKLLNREDQVVAIICDEKLLGKEFKRGKLKLKIDEGFYAGREASVEECLAALRTATVANLVGSIVKSAVEVGLVDGGSVVSIQGVPHAQFVRF